MRFIIVDKYELEKGIKKESSEHGMSYEEAKRTAIDHLKERPDYYSVAEKAGLEEKELNEWYDSVFTKKNSGKGRYGKVKNKKNPFTVVGTPAKIGS
jgi:hypothetical protein